MPNNSEEFVRTNFANRHSSDFEWFAVRCAVRVARQTRKYWKYNPGERICFTDRFGVKRFVRIEQ